MARRGKRGLSAEDRALWQKVTEHAIPLKKDPVLPEKPKPKVRKVSVEHEPLQPFRIGQTARTSVSHKADTAAKSPIHMDKKQFRRMVRGKMSPDARIDLHGMTLAQAHPALNRFIHDNHARGARLVLVITGKGKSGDDHGPIPVRQGVLRHQVPHWLTMPPLAHLILQVTPAHQSHGGGGAFYVYLRRSR